eukprot:78091-Pyramimonas_sp.AAC.1
MFGFGPLDSYGPLSVRCSSSVWFRTLGFPRPPGIEDLGSRSEEEEGEEENIRYSDHAEQIWLNVAMAGCASQFRSDRKPRSGDQRH